MRFLLFFSILVFLTKTFPAFGQAGEVDISFNGDLINYGIGPNEAVMSIAALPDGKFILGGFFREYNGTTQAGLVKVNEDGSIDSNFDIGTGLEGDYNSAVPYKIIVGEDSKILIVGSFQYYNGIPRKNIAQINADGSLDLSFNTGLGPDTSVIDAVLQEDGKIIIIGYFSEFDGHKVNGIARINQDGSFDETFHGPQFRFLPGGNSIGTINKINIQNDGKTLISGYFNQVNGNTLNGIARLNPDGSLDLSFNPDLGDRSIIKDLILLKDGKFLASGNFRNKDGNIKFSLARFMPDGNFDINFTVPFWEDTKVAKLAVDEIGRILVGLEIKDEEDVGFVAYTAVKLERLDPNGNLDQTFNPDFKTPENGDNFIFEIALGINGNILVGVQFWDFPDPYAQFMLALDENGFLDSNFNPSPGANSPIDAMALDQEGKILIGGQFTRYQGKQAKGIARLLPDGELDTLFNTGLGFNQRFQCLAVQEDGRILVGGFFTEFDGIPINRIARLNNNGSIDQSFDPGQGANGFVSDIQIQKDGKILLGGLFSKFNGLNKANLIRLNPDGSIDESFELDLGFRIDVYKIVILENGKILAGGGWGGLVRLHQNGSLDNTFNTMASFSSIGIGGFEIQPNGKLLAFGSFRIGTSLTLYSVVRLNQNGSFDASFSPISHPIPIITSIALQSDGKVLIGGRIFEGNGMNLLRFNSDGKSDNTLDASSGPYSTINSILLQRDGKILIAGDFTLVNNINRFRIARLLNDVDCNLELKANDGITLTLDKNGKARLTPEMVDEGSCSTCGPVKLFLSKCDFTCEDLGEQTVEFKVTDKKGNVEKVQIKVTVEDEISPTTTIENQSFVWIIQSGDTFTMPDFRSIIGASDNCSFEVKQTPAPGTQFKRPQISQIHFEVIDNSGNVTPAQIGFTLLVFKCLEQDNNARIKVNSELGIVSIPWNTSLEEAVRKGLQFEVGSDQATIKKIIWTSNGYNRLTPGDYRLNASFKNTFIEEMDPSIDVILRVRNKPLAEDISINNNVIQRNVSKNEIIGKLQTKDKADDIHTYSMQTHPDFYIEKDVLIWKGNGTPSFETTLTVHSLDRAGQSISREIVLQRELSKINELLIYPNPTFGNLNLELKLSERANVWLRIFDVQGKLVWENSYENKTSFHEVIDWNSYRPGMYSIQVNDGFSIKSYRFVKK